MSKLRHPYGHASHKSLQLKSPENHPWCSFGDTPSGHHRSQSARWSQSTCQIPVSLQLCFTPVFLCVRYFFIILKVFVTKPSIEYPGLFKPAPSATNAVFMCDNDYMQQWNRNRDRIGAVGVNVIIVIEWNDGWDSVMNEEATSDGQWNQSPSNGTTAACAHTSHYSGIPSLSSTSIEVSLLCKTGRLNKWQNATNDILIRACIEYSASYMWSCMHGIHFQNFKICCALRKKGVAQKSLVKKKYACKFMQMESDLHLRRLLSWIKEARRMKKEKKTLLPPKYNPHEESGYQTWEWNKMSEVSSATHSGILF